jgi:hypothetical protein
MNVPHLRTVAAMHGVSGATAMSIMNVSVILVTAEKVLFV